MVETASMVDLCNHVAAVPGTPSEPCHAGLQSRPGDLQEAVSLQQSDDCNSRMAPEEQWYTVCRCPQLLVQNHGQTVDRLGTCSLPAALMLLCLLSEHFSLMVTSGRCKHSCHTVASFIHGTFRAQLHPVLPLPRLLHADAATGGRCTSVPQLNAAMLSWPGAFWTPRAPCFPCRSCRGGCCQSPADRRRTCSMC